MSYRPAASLAALSLVVAACTSSGGGTDATSPVVTTATSTTTSVPADPGLLAVVDGTTIVTMAPDGSGRATVAAGDANTQPVWSPDGNRLAWAFAADGRAGVAISDGPTVDLGTLPFYLSWAPDGTRVAYLIPSLQGGIEFGLVDAASGEISDRDTGQPYYFSWAPDGSAMLRHVGNTLTETGLAPQGTQLGRPAAFQAPSWVGDIQLFAITDTDGDRLILRHISDGTREEIGRLDGFSLFALAPDGRRAAWLDARGGTPAVAAVQRAQSTGPALKILDIEAGTTVTLDSAIAFFWNRQGTRLLYLTPAEATTLQWHVWSSDATADLDIFEPSATLAREYLPFFDQFAQSHNLWSRDGEAFLFAGTVAGKAGIWIRHLADGSATWVAAGEAAVWS